LDFQSNQRARQLSKGWTAIGGLGEVQATAVEFAFEVPVFNHELDGTEKESRREVTASYGGAKKDLTSSGM